MLLVTLQRICDSSHMALDIIMSLPHNNVKKNFKESSMNVEDGPFNIPKKNPTAADVARLAGVSRTQVSYVLNNNRMEHVSDENKQKILDAAKALGYQPHSYAQSLRRGYSKEFSIFFPAPYTPYINGIIGKVHETGLEDGFSPIQYSFNSYEHKERLYQSLHIMLNKKPFAVFCSLFDLEREELNYMLSQGVKKLLVWDLEQHKDLPTLYVPIYEIGGIIAEHFQRKGYSNIGFIKPSDPLQQRAFELRLTGFKKAWKNKSELKLEILDWPDNYYRPTLEAARLFVKAVRSKGSLPRAIYAYGDDYALPLMTVLHEEDYRIPEDVALMGTDNISYSEMSRPKLTTIQMDVAELGTRAVAMMNHLITDQPLEDKFKEPARPVLIEREST